MYMKYFTVSISKCWKHNGDALHDIYVIQVRSITIVTTLREEGPEIWGSVTHISFLLIHLLIAIVLTPGGSNTVHIYKQTVHRTTELATLVGRLSGIRTQIGQTKINDELTA